VNSSCGFRALSVEAGPGRQAGLDRGVAAEGLVHVPLGGSHGDCQPVGDLLVGVAEIYQGENIDLGFAQKNS
jgi:hypothetical protein